jgi:hypothetical protein
MKSNLMEFSYCLLYLSFNVSLCSRGKAMNRLACAPLIAGAIFVLSAASANAVSCTSEISRFEDAVRHSGSSEAFGPTATQSIDAQLGHQPTAGSVMLAERQAQTEFRDKLAQAKNYAAQGNEAECMQALGDAKLMFAAR